MLVQGEFRNSLIVTNATSRGDQEEFVLNEKLKHWRFRMYMLPLKPFLQSTAQIRDSGPEGRCRSCSFTFVIIGPQVRPLHGTHSGGERQYGRGFPEVCRDLPQQDKET